MAESNNRSSRFAEYDNMSTEELQQILREDASKPDGQESDMDELFYVMDVLANRRKAQNEGKTPEEALESFKRYYHPEITDDSSLASAKTFVDNKSRKGNWKRGLIAAAAMLVIVMSCTLTADAWGYDFWDTVAKWTQETFHFGYAGQIEETNVPTPESQYPFTSLQEALDQCNITAKLVPTWIPDGYTEVQVHITETPKQNTLFAVYQSNNDSLLIRISQYLDTHPFQIEQSSNLIEVYSVNDIDYYIFENNGQLKAAWIKDIYECFISGPVTPAELKEMINSIEKS